MSEATPAGETAQPRPVSVIATVLNERESIGDLVEGLMEGDRRPDEIVVADAGSTDGTREQLTALQQRYPPLRVIDVPGNRSRGRNAAITTASHDLIAATDGGCRPQRDWLTELLMPFGSGAEWVGGFYRPVGTPKQVCIGLTMVYVLEEARAGGFLPSTRSVAFTRSAWEAAGGFPEDLEVSEDTAFDERLATAGYEMVFQPEAVVGWSPPETFRRQARVVWAWSRSDGRAGVNSFGYRWQARLVLVGLVMAIVLALSEPWVALGGVVPLADLMWRETRFKYRWAPGYSRFLWIPLAWGVGLAVRLVGFTVGRLGRRRAER